MAVETARSNANDSTASTTATSNDGARTRLLAYSTMSDARGTLPNGNTTTDHYSAVLDQRFQYDQPFNVMIRANGNDT